MGRFWTRDTYEGNQEEPLSLHKYLYCQANPINLTDPTGHDGELGSLMTTIAIQTMCFARTAVTVYTAYTEAENIVDAVQIAAVVAGGGSVSYAKVAGLAVSFVPFGKLLNSIGAAKVVGTVGQGLLKQVYRITGKSQVSGEVGALMAIYQQGFKRIGFKPAYHGFDDIVEDEAGNLIIVEAKGGTSRLATVVSDNQQMSRGWIREKIANLRRSGQNDIADRLQKQIAQGKVKGMVVTTPISGPDAFHPLVELKDWSQIGDDTW
jgi:hypothetical protein